MRMRMRMGSGFLVPGSGFVLGSGFGVHGPERRIRTPNAERTLNAERGTPNPERTLNAERGTPNPAEAEAEARPCDR
jgi:hypothetical protein